MKKIMRLVMVCAVAFAVSAGAQESAWQFKITPYAWALGLDGDVGAHGMKVPVDVKFTDVVDELDIGGMLSLEANNGTWGVLADGVYYRLDDDTHTAAGPASAEVEEWILQGAAVYRVFKSDKTLVDAGAGGRFVDMDTDVSVAGVKGSATESWADPIVVMRVRQQFAKNCFGVLGGDIGGFGVASDLTWQLIAAAGYSFNESVSLLVGYRYLDYDYDDGLVYDAASSGVALGLQFSL